MLRGLGLVGGVFLVYLAVETWRGLKREDGIVDERVRGVAETYSGPALLGRALLVNALSPGPWVFWGTVMGPLLLQQWRLSTGRGLAFLAAFYGTFLGMLTVLLLVFSFARRLGPRVARAGTWLGVVLLLAFAALLLLYGLGVIDRHGV